MKEVKVTVVSQKGFCGAGHKEGDSWVCGSKTPEGICAAAFAAIYPTLRALAAGGSFDWAHPDGSMDVACPDNVNPLVLRLKAID